MAKAVVVDWNGEEIPEQLRKLPAGRYVLTPADECIPLTEEEEAGLVAALKSTRTHSVSHDEVMSRARKILAE